MGSGVKHQDHGEQQTVKPCVEVTSDTESRLTRVWVVLICVLPVLWIAFYSSLALVACSHLGRFPLVMADDPNLKLRGNPLAWCLYQADCEYGYLFVPSSVLSLLGASMILFVAQRRGKPLPSSYAKFANGVSVAMVSFLILGVKLFLWLAD